VRRIRLQDGKLAGEEILFEELQERIRDVRAGPDGALYLLTDSPEGRLLRVVPSQ
jgi:glucose/arabinose dehydrogenase